MKTILATTLFLISTSALAHDYQDRQRALDAYERALLSGYSEMYREMQEGDQKRGIIRPEQPSSFQPGEYGYPTAAYMTYEYGTLSKMTPHACHEREGQFIWNQNLNDFVCVRFVKRSKADRSGHT